MSILLDGTGGVTTPGVVNTAGETIATTLSVTGATNLSALTTTGNTILGDASTDTLNVGNGGLVKDASGNVGIGTASPTQKLDITATGASNAIAIAQNTTATSGGAQLRTQNPQNYLILGVDTNSGGLTGTANAGFLYGGNASILFMPNATTQAAITAAGLFQFNSGYGSVATAYGCRAWVNFNGTGTVAIRASGNVSSITDNGVGSYQANFTTAMPDANYALAASGDDNVALITTYSGTYSTTTARVDSRDSRTGAAADWSRIGVIIIR